MSIDWTTFGRVDADGTVYVKTAAGERVVGSWQAGTPEEGLAHFARRYDGVVTEVSLIETRLSTGAGDAAHALTRVKELRKELDEPHCVGDIDGLIERLDKLASAAETKVGEVHAARAAARAEAAARKTALVEEAEALAAESTSWKSATGSRRSWRSGRPSAGSTARPTVSSGSATRPRATRSPGGAAPTSPPWTPPASRRRARRRRSSRRPRSWPPPANGRPRRPGSRS